MSWSSLKRRWPEAVLAVALLLAALLSGLLVRAAALVLLAGLVVFTVRRRVRDVALATGIGLLILLGAVVATLTLDIGSAFDGSLRKLAERQGSKYLSRPLHIGRLGVHLASGRFVVENLRIDGVTPTDKPFFTAREIRVGLSWGPLISRRQVLIDSVDMTGWEMLVQKWGDRHNFVKFGSGRKREGPSPVTTRVRIVRAMRGQFTYLDHGSWTTVARNLEIKVTNDGSGYRGRGSLTNGSVQIRDYLPMRADMNFSFRILKGGVVDLDRIDMITDGAVSKVTGVVDLGHWPEQTYRVRSQVDLWRMREIFFARERWRSRGGASFTGVFHLFKGGHRLTGSFGSPLAFVNQFAFPDLRGTLVWEPSRFEVLEASAKPYGGGARFSYSMKPLGDPAKPGMARFQACYEEVDIGRFADAVPMRGVRPLGRLGGCNLLEYPLGRFSEHRGDGHMTLTPPPGVTLLTRDEAPHEAAIHAAPVLAGPEPSVARAPYWTPVGGQLRYRYGPEWVDIEPGHMATDRVYVEFQGRTAYGERSHFPFYTRSADWQEGDRLLAGIITAFGSPTGVIKVGGWGEFEGTMTGAFSSPRIEGTFRGDGMRAWDVVWGRGTAQIVIQNGYVDVARSVVTRLGSEIRADGRFSLGYPRKDRGEEIDARVTIRDRPLADLRHAFELDDWPVEGKLSGDYHLSGHYTTPFGFGNVTLRDMTAWGEPFDAATCTLRFEGAGVRVDGLEIRKGGGAITGAAYVGWDGRYSFNADGRRIALESVAAVKLERAPLSGVAHFNVNGSSTFLAPKWDLVGRIEDVFMGDEGIGVVRGRLAFREKLLTLEMDAASPRLVVSGTGQVELTPTADANLSLRFTKTSLDPYVRLFQPKLSPYTRAEASGTIRAVGQLANRDQLRVDVSVDDLSLRLFDYDLVNDPAAGPVRLVLDSNVAYLGAPPASPNGVSPNPIVLKGRDTRLEVSGLADLAQDRVRVRLGGDANLAILQAFFRDIASSGRAAITGTIQGSLAKPVLSGNARITDGRIRYYPLPHSIQNIDGNLVLGANGIQLDDVTARVAGGSVRFGGRIQLNGFTPGQLSLTASGERMDIRYPEGFRSLIDAQLDLVGTLSAPTLKGEITVRSATYRKRIELSPGLLELASGRSSAPPPSRPAGSFPLRFDLHVNAPSALRIDTNLLRMVASADMYLRGDYDRPLLWGRAEVEQGEAIFEGKRYFVREGVIDFNDTTKIEPSFDVSAETRVRAPGQTYIVDIRLNGTFSRLQPPQLTSDPPLPPLEIITLLFGDPTRTAQDPELRALQNASEDRARLATSRVEQAIVGTATSPVTSAVERVVGLETFQITPNFYDPYQRVPASARLTVGKRVSEKVYLTISRSIRAVDTNDLIVLLEYDQSQRLSWILSRNEDGTYALEGRVRHAF